MAVVTGTIASVVTTAATNTAGAATTSTAASASSGLPGGGLLSAAQHPGATRVGLTEGRHDYFNDRNNGHIAADGGFVARLNNAKFGSKISTYKNETEAAKNSDPKDAKGTEIKSGAAAKKASTDKQSYREKVEKIMEEEKKVKAENSKTNLSKEQQIAKDTKDFILRQIVAGEAHGGQLADGRNAIRVIADLNKKLGLPENHTNGVRIPS